MSTLPISSQSTQSNSIIELKKQENQLKEQIKTLRDIDSIGNAAQVQQLQQRMKQTLQQQKLLIAALQDQQEKQQTSADQNNLLISPIGKELDKRG